MGRFEDMQTFVRVVEAGNISRAAERMGIAKSAVSRRIAELEQRLGAELFRRTTRRLNLTDTGRGFYERSLRILADLEEAELAVSREHGSLQGKLRIAVPLSFGLLHLGPAITDFMQAQPQVQFDLDFNDRQVDLMEEGFDLAIRIARLAESSLIARRLATIRHVPCASPAYLARHGTPRKPADLQDHSCLVYSNVPDPRKWSYEGPDGKAGSVKVPVRLAASNGDFLCSAASDGLGVALLPTFIPYQAIEQRRLVPLLTDFQWPTLDVYAVYPHTRHLSARVRAFVDYLVDRFSGVPYWDRCCPTKAHAPG